MLENVPIFISQEESDYLTKDIIEKEIHASVWSLELGKPPGLDGFTICFFKAC
jgi:hypothetical protein